MKFNAKLNNIRIAPRKTKLTADLIKGLDVKEALDQLDSNIKRINPEMKKLLLSAMANGENNFGIDKDNMYVLDIRVGAGPVLKRWMPKAFGRAGKILKRTSRIEIILEERVEGKNRKTKEQIEEEKNRKAKERAKEEREKKDREEMDSEKKPQDKTEEKKKEDDRSKKEVRKQGWVKKMFQRKSM